MTDDEKKLIKLIITLIMDGYGDECIDKCGKCYTPCLRQGEELGNFV